jgi:hypothetical protein
MQAAGGNAVGAALILLNLLKADTDGLAELRLGDAQNAAATQKLSSNVFLYLHRRLGLWSGLCTPRYFTGELRFGLLALAAHVHLKSVRQTTLS